MAMANDDVGTAPGFRFKPSDDELINFYLKPKILKQHLSYKIMDEVDLYASDSTPWLLFDIQNPDSWDDDNSLYVFTCLSKVSGDPNFVATKSRINNHKKAGCGTWVQKTSPVPIKDCAGNVIGGRRMLVFNVSEIGDGFDDTKAVYFKMHEYSMWGINEGLCCDGRDVVLCKISFDVSKKSPFKLITEKSSDHVSKIVEKTKKNKKKIQRKKNVGESKALNTSEVVEESKGLDSECIDGSVGYAAALNATVPYVIDLDVLDDKGLNSECIDGSVGYAAALNATVPYEIDLDVLDDKGLNSECIDGSVGYAAALNATVPYEIDLDVLDDKGLNSECIDGSVGYAAALNATVPYEIDLDVLDEFRGGVYSDGPGGEGMCFDGLDGEDMFFDMDEMMQYLNSPEEDETTICGLGKRKSIEGNNSCQAKRICL
ncbi:hypothetical protein POM88_043191 [Heracleum sosnowskyi]|uniref:NAC domain-containing protein n=1 Tax=Heracleum sosnowskyi TaxID=360622 RepID=A0AAD8H0J1_9APIA|nr:hypothetical protein POM88_043191 [Heracleum sosnowskyi]